MITIYPFESLGHYDFGWLDARYHFSFARYYNPERMGFGRLRVVNDDIVKPGRGFAPHEHDNMEIITYVRKGAITHKDSNGNEGRTEAGDVQVMSAGSGIEHSEFNHETTETSLYQIWIEPSEKGVKPHWDARKFPREAVNDSLPVLVSGYDDDLKDGVLKIHADAAIYGGRLSKGTEVSQNLRNQGYLLISKGRVSVDGTEMKQGDGAEIKNLDSITLSAIEDSEIVLIDVAA